MHPNSTLTLQTQLWLPLTPFTVDTLVRAVFLRDHIAWYQIPDLVTFLATFSFFCLGIMSAVNPRAVPSDPELNLNIEIVRQRLLASSIITMTFAGLVSGVKAFHEMLPALNIYQNYGLPLFLIATLYTAYVFFRICWTYLSYVHRA